MIGGPEPLRLTLAVHPSSGWLSWTAFQGPLAPFDWGRSVTRGDKNRAALARVEKLIDRLSPETLVLEAFEGPGTRRSPRVIRLYRAIIALGNVRGIEVAIYSRSDVKACFAHVGARSRQEIAEAVQRHNPLLRATLPRPRQAWDAEDHRMALYSAAALVMTHYHRDATSLLSELRDAA